MRLIKPNFQKNIINITSSLAKFLDVQSCVPSFSYLDKRLENIKKNNNFKIVFIIFDGLGSYPLKKNLNKKAFLRKNQIATLSSVFPSTTTNATTTMLTNKYPLEHGWLGWNLYFAEIDQVIDLFLDVNDYTKMPIERGFVRKKLPTLPFYKDTKSSYQIKTIAPSYWYDGLKGADFICDDLDDYFITIKKLLSNEGNEFLYVYCPEPDHTMHLNGVTHPKTKELIAEINQKIEDLAINSKDTLFIITADHGQIDVDGYIDFYLDEELLKQLEHPFSLEARAVSLKIKPEYQKSFPSFFRKKYHHDFILYSVSYLVKKGYFGPNITPYQALLGDFLAVCKTNKVVRFNEKASYHLGHHGSLTKEMQVPLIIFSNK